MREKKQLENKSITISNLKIIKESLVKFNENFYYFVFVSTILVTPAIIGRNFILATLNLTKITEGLQKNPSITPAQLSKIVATVIPASAIPYLALFTVFSYFLTSFATLAIIKAANSLTEGKKAKIYKIYNQALKRLLPFMGYEIIVFLAFIPFLVMAVLVPRAGVFLILPGLVAYVWLFFGRFFVALENTNPLTAIKNSINLIKGNWINASFSIISFWLLGSFLESIILSSIGNIKIIWLNILVELLANVFSIYVTIAFVFLYREVRDEGREVSKPSIGSSTNLP